MDQNQPSRLFPLPRKIFPFILFALGLILMITSAYFILRVRVPQTAFNIVPAKVQFPAPEIRLTDIQGHSHSLADYRGQVVLVNLWATWCLPCKQEMPILQSFYNRYKEAGFVIIAINDGDPAADVLQFVKDYELTFPVWLDPTYIATEQAFNAPGLPTSFVIDRNGTIQLTWVGGISAEMLEAYVTPLITES
jgi:cytochrome c biogenesis protein CcmG, thiol:disulfide interchange protein DsbE